MPAPHVIKMIVVGNDDSSHLKVYKFYVDEKTYLPALKVAGKIKKHSEGTVIHMNYQNKKLLVIQNNCIEIFRIHQEMDTIAKKLIKSEKRLALKRTKKEQSAEQDEEPAERKVDKGKIQEMLENGDYDITLHFSKKGVIELQEKVRSAITFYHNDAAEIYLSMGSLN